MAKHRAQSKEDELVEQGHLDPESAESFAAAFARMHELEEAARKAPAGGGLSYVKSFPYQYGVEFCMEHNEDGYSTCIWDDPDELFEALYDVTSTNPQVGIRQAHRTEQTGPLA